uniref:Uncharacterized protein n=1 Tax=Meloidogyne enterolobii TaxID=390850 RepID=A0A6V7WKB6_MELEN|nr:unnamed protein product [Meloidogyne enterolobii]
MNNHSAEGHLFHNNNSLINLNNSSNFEHNNTLNNNLTLTSNDTLNKNNLWECTEMIYYRWSGNHWLMGVGYLPILFIGLISDMISIRVFSAKSMRTRQINLYLLLISITDMLILLDTTVSFTAVGFGYLIKWKWLVETRHKNYFLIFLIIIFILK